MTLRKVHRYLGLLAAIMAIYLSITGILLNHSHDLQLDRSRVHSVRVLSWYGITPPESIAGYKLGQNWVTQFNDQIFFNDKPLAYSDSRITGAINIAGFVLISNADSVWLLTDDGQVVEKLANPVARPGKQIRLRRLGSFAGRAVIGTTHGRFMAEQDFSFWKPVKDIQVVWSVPVMAPPAITRMLVDQTHSITLERLLLDLHSGRIATRGGVILVDLVGIALILLAISGVTIWYIAARRRTRSRTANHPDS